MSYSYMVVSMILAKSVKTYGALDIHLQILWVRLWLSVFSNRVTNTRTHRLFLCC